MTIHRTDSYNRKHLTFRISSISRRQAGGAWIKGNLMGFTFEALVFPEHAAYPDYEIERSRISKLWLQRPSDDEILYSWDRGLDIPVTDADARRAVQVLCAILAVWVYGSEP